MTTALCFNCGDLKFGAICPCPTCRVSSTGNMELDIALSDHNYSKDTLTELGKVIKMIHGVSDSPQECFWAFLQYVTIHHSELLAIELPEGMAEPVARILAAIQLPPITLQPSWRAKPEDEQNS